MQVGTNIIGDSVWIFTGHSVSIVVDRLRKATRNLRIRNSPAEIRTDYLSNMGLERYV
jgi:hypothetical protein